LVGCSEVGLGAAEEKSMSDLCGTCGSTKSQAIEEARTLSLLDELNGGVYTCCQITAWAREQRLAWWHAASDDRNAAYTLAEAAEAAEQILVPVRLRRRADSRS
jgi:hypothetical protein